MVYVLVYRRYDYHEFDEVIAASNYTQKIHKAIEAQQEKMGTVKIPTYIEDTPLYEKDYQRLVFDEIPHFVIMEFLE